jgi:PAS domain S-box-containing protein
MAKNSDNNKFSALRSRAQEFLAEKPDNAILSSEDIQRVLHELDTYRIELELQNQDLCQVQIELEKSHRRYADLYDFAPVAYLTVSDTGMIVEANLTAAEMLGVARGQLRKRPFSSFILPEDQDVFYLHRGKMLKTRQRQSYELRLQKHDRSVFHALLETAVSLANGDYPGQYLVIVSDISVHKEAELAKLHRLKDRYRAIVMDQNEMICRFDPEGRITFVNDAYCRFFGVTYQEILGTNFLPNIYKEDLPIVRNHFKDLTQENPEKTIEHRVLLSDGKIYWQQWVGRALFGREGKVREYQAVGRDITRLKETEARLREEARIRQLFMDALPCVAMLLRYESREIVASNTAAVAIGAIPGKQCFATFAKSDCPCPWCLAPQLWQSGEAQHSQFWALDIYWDAYWIPVAKDLYLHYAFDTTEQWQNKEALKTANEALEQRILGRTTDLEKSHKQLLHAEKLSAAGRLSASIAHEFNNPLQSVMTIFKGIEKFVPLEEKEKNLVALALQECYRMKKLVANLRDFYRPSSGNQEQVNIHEVFDGLLLMGKKDYQIKKLTVVKKYGDNIPHIDAVADQLKQVFLNLLNNASDACEGNGGMITITTEIKGQEVGIHIEDNGVGIDPKNIDQIYEPFFTTKSTLKGTGLGLPVSYGIVKKHGGRIEVKSEPGNGSKFSVFLPIAAVAHD